jgi:hypothetical protein
MNRMKMFGMLWRILFAGFLLVVVTITSGFAIITDDRKDSLRSETLAKQGLPENNDRQFAQLDSVTVDSFSDPIVVNDITSDSTVHYRSKALEYQNEVTRRNALISNLNNLSLLELPVGLSRPGTDLNYTVIISKARFNPAGAFLEAYFIFELPQTGDKVAFRGTDIKFSYDGGLVGDGRMELIGSYPIKLSDKTLLTILGKGNTYVEFNCDGFKGMGIESEVEFSRDLIIPEDEKGNQLPAPARIKTTFAVYAQSWSDILVSVNLPPFQVNGLKGVGFSVQQAYLDWSDLANPAGLMFPQNYPSPFIQAGDHKLWQGFYLQRLSMRLPPSFAQKKSNARVTVGVENMILDDLGFSGTVFAENLIEAGDMSGWSYSLDRFGLEVVTNQVKGFDLAGKISVPNLKKKKDNTPSEFKYVAMRSAEGDYIFSVGINEELRLPLFVANLNLAPGSSITVKEKENKFYPTAFLNGELAINVLGKGPKASFNAIRFEGLKISSEDPHFDIQAVGFGKEGHSQSVSKYPLVINNILLRKEGERIGIGFDVTINIAGKSEDEGFGGTAALVVWGKHAKAEIKSPEGQVTSSEDDAWEFDKVELSGIGVNFKKAGVIEIAGMIRFFEDDPIYGDGFKGSVSGKIQVISLQIEALFGKTPEYRYWYADALVEFKSGIPLAPGFSAYGFGGGYYSRMKQSTESVNSTIGQTASGITYVPDENTIGIKAIVKFGATPSQAPYNGDVMLEVMLNRHGGINSVAFSGNIVVMSPPIPGGADKIKSLAASAVGGKGMDKLMQALQGQVSASVKILFDNVNDVFHANMEIYINVAGGIVKGVGNNNRAGWAVMHFAKDEWYVLIGTPNDPVGLELLWLLKVRSYFMLGKNLPGSPPPPRQVSEILGISADDLDYMRDLNAAESGFGFAFGLNLSMDTGDLRFLMFYARFAAGIGTDIMIKKYGDEYHCVGSDETIGINGWFANGQAYAYVQGKIGIKVKLRFYKGDFDILSIGAAAVLQAKGPNPFWMRGIVGGYYRILGGLVKGNCKFEVTIGKECKVVGNSNPLEGINMISEVSPAKGQNDVDVFNAPQAAFNMPVGEVFNIVDIENKKRSFRSRLGDFIILDGSSSVEGTIRWNDELDVAVFDAHDVLPPKKELKVVVRLTFEEQVGAGWKTVVFEGKNVEEIVETNFTTGEAPDHIPTSNIANAYPIAGQYNFYPKEYNQGFIELKRGQPYLFSPGEEWVQTLRMSNTDPQGYVETTLSYNAAEKKVLFTIPAGFQNDKVYRLDILSLPRQQAAFDANVQNVESDLIAANEAGDATLTTKKIEGNLEIREAKSLYSIFFKTSKYNTFTEKLRAMSLSPAVSGNPGNNVIILGAYWKGSEYFDGAELGSDFDQRRFIQTEAVLSGNNWYEKEIYPLIYEGYPLAGMTIKNRDVSILGQPPVKDMAINQQRNDLRISESGEKPDAASYFAGSILEYRVPMTMFQDYYDLQRQVANYVVNHSSGMTSRFAALLVDPFPVIDYGKYKVRLTYKIPGTEVITSSHEVEMNYSRSR